MPDVPATHGGPVPARDAATIMLVRDALHPDGSALEVCMLRRHVDSGFVGGAYVFPGGKVDDEDRSAAAGDACTGRDDVDASDLLGVPAGGLAFWVAALRECFEEAGVLLAYAARPGPGGLPAGTAGPTSTTNLVDTTSLVDMSEPGARHQLAVRREELNAGNVGFLDLLRSEGLRLAVDRVHYFSHWITPEPAPKRYDTRFFVTALPPGQVPVHDDHETTDTVWVRPADALARAAAGELDLIFPTMKNLEAVSRFDSADALLAAAAAVERVPTVLPRVVADHNGFRILLPGDPGYDDALGAVPVGGAAELSSAEVGAIVRSVGVDGRSERRT